VNRALPIHVVFTVAAHAGVVLVELVREFLRWCNLQFTLQVRQQMSHVMLPSGALVSCAAVLVPDHLLCHVRCAAQL
jgi:hypothetical protein